MSAIGDYIHNTAYGYNEFGTNLMNGTPQSEAYKMAILRNQFNYMHSKMRQDQNFLSEQEITELENQLSLFSKPDLKDSERKEIDLMLDIIEEVLEQQFQASAENINRLTHDVIQGIRIATKKIKPKNGQESILTSTLLKRIADFNASIGQLSFSETYMAKINANMEALYKIIDQLKVLSQTATKETDFKKIMEEGRFINRKIDLLKELKYEKGKDNTNAISIINETIGLINGSANVQKGMLEQAIVALAPLVGANMTKEALKEAVKGAVKESLTKVTFQGNLFSDKVDLPDILGEGYHSSVGNTYINAMATPDKIDVTIDFGNRQLPISVKNVSFNTDNSSPYVRLVSQSSLLALLQSIGPEYTNHYLNIVSKHRKVGRWGSSKVGNGKITSARGQAGQIIRPALLQQVKESIRLSLLVAAFQGYKKNNEVGYAKVFVINDNQTGRVKVYNIGTLVLRLLEQQQYLNRNSVKIQGNKIEVENIRFDNSFIPGPLSLTGAYERITNLLAQVHKYKISVAVRKSVTFGQLA